MIHANNAGTSWPKPPEVAVAMRRALDAPPDAWGELYDEAHATICAAFNAPDPSRLILTSGCTQALALAFTALPWRAGDRLITSSLEHHALSRWPIGLGLTRGVIHEVAPRTPDAPLDLDALERLLRGGGVRLVAITAASNVTGERLPVAEVTRLAHAHGARCLVDAAQTAGVVPIDLATLGADILTIAGHKGPLGPQGIGVLHAGPDVVFELPAASCDLRVVGRRGCGSFFSFCDVGSVNLPGACGLAAGLRWLTERGVDTELARLRGRIARLIEGIEALPGLTIHGHRDPTRRTGALSITAEDASTGELQAHLATRGVIARAGFHCAPLAHEALGTETDGTLRLSLGPFNSDVDVNAILEALTSRPRSAR